MERAFMPLVFPFPSHSLLHFYAFFCSPLVYLPFCLLLHLLLCPLSLHFHFLHSFTLYNKLFIYFCMFELEFNLLFASTPFIPSLSPAPVVLHFAFIPFCSCL